MGKRGQKRYGHDQKCENKKDKNKKTGNKGGRLTFALLIDQSIVD